MPAKKILIHVVALAVLMLPVAVFAHGAVQDEHAEEAVMASDGHTDHDHSVGGSELLVAFSSAWWGLLGVSVLLTVLLSFGVWKFLHVPPIKKPDVNYTTTHS